MEGLGWFMDLETYPDAHGPSGIVPPPRAANSVFRGGLSAPLPGTRGSAVLCYAVPGHSHKQPQCSQEGGAGGRLLKGCNFHWRVLQASV